MTPGPTAAAWGARLSLAAGVAAALKVVVGAAVLGAAVASGVPGVGARHALLFAHAAIFAVAASVLVGGGRRDERAVLLGVAFLLIASDFSVGPGALWEGRGGPTVRVALFVLALRVDAFLPYVAWQFARRFPNLPPSPRWDARLARMTAIALVLGVALFVAGAVARLDVTPSTTTALGVAVGIARGGSRWVYWPAVLTLTGSAAVAVAARARHAPPDERRRVGLLVVGLTAGTLPGVLWVILTELVPLAREVLPLRVAGWVAYPALLSTPLVATYAVLVRQALDVRLVVRRALQYALARSAALGMMALPAAALGLALYRSREVRLATLLGSPAGVALAGLGLLGALVVGRGGTVLDRIDRRFFREQYDARAILAELVTRCREARDLAALTSVLRVEIDRALHLTGVHLLVLDAAAGTLVAPDASVRPWLFDSPLVRVLRERREPTALDVPVDVSGDLSRPDPAVADVADDDRRWLADLGARLVVPIVGADGGLLGSLVLGEKRSELPFTTEDRALLRQVAGAAAMALAYHAAPSLAADAAEERCALECVACGAVFVPDTPMCATCGGALGEATLPPTVDGKFVVQQRIGRGGMGVVYRAFDATLDRTVAIKTVAAFVSPQEADRIRHEAQTMALIAHEHLARIYVAVTWRGKPMLVVEHLGCGTLADRLERGTLAPDAVVTIGFALAGALAAIHDAGVLHSDVKPSNIGFTSQLTPRLLDFGLARLVGPTGEVAGASPAVAGEDVAARWREHESRYDTARPAPSLLTRFGTPRYMSPEALSDAPPSPGDDLWSLGVVLYEAATGRHPFDEDAGGDPWRDGPPDVRSFAATASPALATLLRDVLSLDAARRPRSAHELRARLRTAGGDAY